MRVVILGAGAGIAQSHLAAIKVVAAETEVEVVAVQDIDLERAERTAEQVGCPAFTSIDEALSVGSDLAVVVAPHPFHAPLAIAALDAGRHVLVEKPIADSVDQADRMLAAAQRNGRLLGVSLQQRTRGEVQAAHELIASGGLGVLQRVDLIGSWPRKRGYFEESPWRGTWRGEGGGVVINQGQHDLDLLTYLVGPPRSVFGAARTRLHHIETEDTAVALLEWSDGAIGNVHLSTVEVDLGQRLEITGTNGRIRLTHNQLEIVENETDFREFVNFPGNPYAAPPTRAVRTVHADNTNHTPVYRNFISAIAGEAALVAPAESALATLELANAMLYSSAINAPVNLPLDRSAYAHFLSDKRS